MGLKARAVRNALKCRVLIQKRSQTVERRIKFGMAKSLHTIPSTEKRLGRTASFIALNHVHNGLCDVLVKGVNRLAEILMPACVRGIVELMPGKIGKTSGEWHRDRHFVKLFCFFGVESACTLCGILRLEILARLQHGRENVFILHEHLGNLCTRSLKKFARVHREYASLRLRMRSIDCSAGTTRPVSMTERIAKRP
jgi:hypothetical protein